LNKKDLVDRVAEDHELTARFARELVDSVFATIANTARNGEEVSISGFGKFKVAERAARKGQNPATGESVKIAA
jgi:DNA-binding protein HU-beta